MASMVKKGINSFKFFMAYKGALMVGDELLLDGLQRCKELGALAMVSIQLSIVPSALLLSGVLYSNICYPGGMPQCTTVGALPPDIVYSVHFTLCIANFYWLTDLLSATCHEILVNSSHVPVLLAD